MREIVILSGKGGTGKTLVSASLAAVGAKEAILADCDVDAANIHLLLQTKAVKTEVFYSGELANINQDDCISCGRCMEVCRFDAIGLSNQQYKIEDAECEGCGYCEKVCPAQAITLKPRRSGIVYVSDSRLKMPVAHARLDPGADNSGKLVAKVKDEARKLARAENKEYVIIDGAPGIGCPVVSSLAGAKYVLFVTEPTQSALHDLKRLHTLLQKFKPVTGCIINKNDLNAEMTQEIKLFLKENRIELVAELPYSDLFAKSMIGQLTVAEADKQMFTEFEKIWKKIKERLS